MNFYASDQYLSVVSDVYFPGRSTEVRTVLANGSAFRLLFVDGRRYVTGATFLDYHRPLETIAAARHDPSLRHVSPVAIRAVPLEDMPETDGATIGLAPFIDWSAFPNHEDYVALLYRRNKGTFKEYDRRLRRLQELHGPVQFAFHDPQEDVLPTAQAWKSSQLLRTGQTDYFADPANVRFFEVMRERGLLLASTLRVADRLVAVWLGFEYQGCLSGWIFAHDGGDEFRKFSVGHQLLRFMIAESHRRGHREFDFSIGDEDYKWLYASHVRLLGEAGIPALTQQVRDLVVRSARQQVKKVPVLYRLLKAAASRRGEARAALPAR
ncbi:MAG: GNAT family N-acetyltransferase [Alsobacter sp.]